VGVIRRTLFEGDTLQIAAFEARPVSDACGEVERQDSNVVVLPLAGVFSKHDSPGRHVIGTPSHAVLVAADTPYRLGYPGGIGDRALILRFGESVAPDQLDTRAGARLAPHGLLSARAMVLRNLLWRRLGRGSADRFEIEALGLDLLGMALGSMRQGGSSLRRSALLHRARALERVKEAVAVAPADTWSVARLARIANLSPFHLCHVFRQMVGTSIHDYVLRERLAHTLDAVLDSRAELTGIALDAGFSSHSHYTARFRRFFGCTPTALRRRATAGQMGELRKIMTAPRSRPDLG
jgi:AraC-like DNA-binding protein